jgi:hypothetical protein
MKNIDKEGVLSRNQHVKKGFLAKGLELFKSNISLIIYDYLSDEIKPTNF